MIYIKKQGLPHYLQGYITQLRKSESWKKLPEGDTEAIRSFFDNQYPKDEIKEILVREQHGLCAYCMRRIKNDRHTTIEHLVPLSADKKKAIDYRNLLGSCHGGRESETEGKVILCCDAHKKEQRISLSPLDKNQMDKIIYNSKGFLSTDPEDPAMNKDINDILGLNGERKEDGTFHDTATELVKGRRDAYIRARSIMERLNRSGKCTSTRVKQIMDATLAKEEWEEFIGVKLFYLGKKYRALIRRGL